MQRIASLGLGKLSVLATLAIVVCTLVVFGQEMFSAGPLSEQHPRGSGRGGVQSHAEITSCSACHAPAWSSDTMATRCLACHDNIGAQLAEHAPMHGKLVAGQECMSCHTEHKGAHGALTNLAKFDHDCAAFKLSGKHRDVKCADCHRDRPFQGTPQTCVSCHAEPAVHLGKFGTECASCHSPATWQAESFGKGLFTSAKFNHDLTGFPLRDKHARVDCKACHVKDGFKGLSQSCVSCHQQADIHKGAFGVDCQLCHGTNSWKSIALHKETFVFLEFDHDTTAFPLTGKHRPVDCRACHANNRFKGTPQSCVSCHAEPASHKPYPLSFGVDCAKCHTTATWTGATKVAKHLFPTNHGAKKIDGMAPVNRCSLCHPATTQFVSNTPAASYANYTCYGCHHHSRDKELKRHANRKVENMDKCAVCHKTTKRALREAGKKKAGLEIDGCPELASLPLEGCAHTAGVDFFNQFRPTTGRMRSAPTLKWEVHLGPLAEQELPRSVPSSRMGSLVEFLQLGRTPVRLPRSSSQT